MPANDNVAIEYLQPIIEHVPAKPTAMAINNWSEAILTAITYGAFNGPIAMPGFTKTTNISCKRFRNIALHRFVVQSIERIKLLLHSLIVSVRSFTEHIVFNVDSGISRGYIVCHDSRVDRDVVRISLHSDFYKYWTGWIKE